MKPIEWRYTNQKSARDGQGFGFVAASAFQDIFSQKTLPPFDAEVSVKYSWIV